jgi:hypothetical protein
MSMSVLIKYDQARQALAACRNVDEIKDIRDKSEAMRLYAKQAQDTELEQWAAEIKFRAQRAIGELSSALETQKGGFGIVPAGGKHKAEVLADAGISTSTANRYEKLAAIPEPVIEEIIAKSKEIGKPVSAKAVMAQVAPKAAPPSTPSTPTPEAARDTACSPSLVQQAGAAPAPAPAPDAADDGHADEDDPFDQVIAENKALEQQRLALQGEIKALNDRIAILTRDDLAAAADEWKMKFEQLSGRNRQLQETARDAQLAEKRAADQLAKIRKALGVASNAEILPALTTRRAA